MWFNRVVGQDKVKKSVHDSIEQGLIPHALILEGRSGYGSLPLALAIAQSILCSEVESRIACGNCKSCQQIDGLIHPDLHLAFPVVKKEGVERKNTTSKDFLSTWRPLVVENPYLSFTDWIRNIARTSANADINVKECNDIIQALNMQSFSGSKKVQIIWFAEYLGSNGNKLLKLIEEPPEGTHIILISERRESLLQTIVSRCQVIQLPRIDENHIASHLSSIDDIDSDLALQISLLSDGDFGLALSYLQLQSNNLLGQCMDWIKMCFSGDFYQLRLWSADFGKYNQEEQKALLKYFLKILQSVVYAIAGNRGAIKMSEGDSQTIVEDAVLSDLEIEQVSRMSGVIGEMIDRINRFVPGRMVAFDGSLSIAEVLRNSDKNVLHSQSKVH